MKVEQREVGWTQPKEKKLWRQKQRNGYSKDINQIMRKKENEWYFNEKGKKRTDRLTGRLSAA